MDEMPDGAAPAPRDDGAHGPPEDRAAAPVSAAPGLPADRPAAARAAIPSGADGAAGAPARRRRGFRATSAAGALALLASLILALLVPSAGGVSSSPAGSGRRGALPTIVSNVSYGVVSLNGQPLGAPPVAAGLRTGANVVTIVAPPFRPRSCTVQWPIDMRDPGTCRVMDVDLAIPPAMPHVSIGLFLTAADLPPDARAGAERAVAAALAAVSLPDQAVPAGDFYATGLDGRGATVARRAAVPLTAAVALAPATAPARCADLGCGSGPLALGGAAPAGVWSVGEAVAVVWTFRDAGGAVVGTVTLPSSGVVRFTLAYDAAHGWRLAAPGPANGARGDLCGRGIEQLWAGLASPRYAVSTLNAPDGGLRGCALAISRPDGTRQGLAVWRFGALLAADAGAQAAAPGLPLAPPDEVAAVA